ncbi:response regulator transcription factor [Aurantibacillus circumpalustris]|uniref:response regulator transcription factor n=1 Tax=Aurantibacillus circumpalustris TaxID=3036359 RepID=UPI00295BC7DD|nr:response regulator transcription factor [Aurantibacillus circumpalustris]
MANKIKIAIADDHTLVSQSLARCIETDKKLQVVGIAENGKVLIEIIKKTKPDLIILDLQMPVMNGWQTLEWIAKNKVQCKIIVMSMLLENSSIKDLTAKGVRGFLPKNTDFETFMNAIHEVSSLGYFFDKKINHSILKELLALKAINPTFNNLVLTDKEKETLILICADKLTKEIASEMQVTERTIERYKSSLYEKTHAKTSAGLILFALKHNYITVDE